MITPFIRCLRPPNAPSASEALSGIYELRGVEGARPLYRKWSGVTGWLYCWFCEDTPQGPRWVVTPGPAASPEGPAKAWSSSRAWWPWEADGWEVRVDDDESSDVGFTEVPQLRFVPVSPVAELSVNVPDSIAASGRFRRGDEVNGRPAYWKIQDDSSFGIGLFYLPKMARWIVAEVGEGNKGIQSVFARSAVADNVVAWWPFPLHKAHGWELPLRPTIGLTWDGPWYESKGVQVSLRSPPVLVSGGDEVPPELFGRYLPEGMLDGRVFYVQERGKRPHCLWFAEARGQWLFTIVERMGDMECVYALIESQAWWPWEARVRGASTSSGSSHEAQLKSAARSLADGKASSNAPAEPVASSCWQVPVGIAGELGPEHTPAMPALGSLERDEQDPRRVGAKGTYFGLSMHGPMDEVSTVSRSFRNARSMVVDLECSPSVIVRGAANAQHPFLGGYKRSGLLSHRPYFVQENEVKAPEPARPEGERQPSRSHSRQRAKIRYALWFAEDTMQWVIAEQRFLADSRTVDARVFDVSWRPWEIPGAWEVTDFEGGFIPDVNLRIERPPR